MQRLNELARELVESKVDIIVHPAVAATTAARHATSTIPIVMVHAGNPIGAGLIASLARPGGNVTGITNMLLGGKQVELIRELVPRVAKLGVLINPTNAGAGPVTCEYDRHRARPQTSAWWSPRSPAPRISRRHSAMLRNARPDGLLVMAEAQITSIKAQNTGFRSKRPAARSLRQ